MTDFPTPSFKLPGLLSDEALAERTKEFVAQQKATSAVAPPPSSATDFADRIIGDNMLQQGPPMPPRRAQQAQIKANASAVESGIKAGFQSVPMVGPLARTGLQALEQLGQLSAEKSQADTLQRNQDEKARTDAVKSKAEVRARLRALPDEQAAKMGLPISPGGEDYQAKGEAALNDAAIGRAQIEYQKEVEALPPVTQTWWLNMMQTGAKSAAQTVTSVPEGLLSIAEGTAELYGIGDPETMSVPREWFKTVDAAMDKMLPGDKGRSKDFLTQLAVGGGSMAAFMAGGYIGAIAGIAPGVAVGGLGALNEANAMYEDAEEHDGTAFQKYLALLLGSALGVTEAVPIDRMFMRLQGQTGGMISKWLRTTAAVSIEEFIQETGQSLGEDVIGMIYDASRQVDVVKAVKQGLVGAITGGAAATAATLATELGAPVPGAPDDAAKEEAAQAAIADAQSIIDAIPGINEVETPLPRIDATGAEPTVPEEVAPALGRVETPMGTVTIRPAVAADGTPTVKVDQADTAAQVATPEDRSRFDALKSLIDKAAPETDVTALRGEMLQLQAKLGEFKGGTPPAKLTPDGQVELTHWSSVARATLDPERQGSGPIRGVERKRLSKADPNYVPRTYFGIDATASRTVKERKAMLKAGTQNTSGYEREGGLGNARHTVHVDPNELYNWYEDPQNLKAKLDRTLAPSEQVTQYEKLISDAGFKGFWMNNTELGQAAALFDARTPTTITDERTGAVLTPAFEDNVAAMLAPEAVAKLNARAPGFAGVLPYLTEKEQDKLTAQGVTKLVKIFGELPPAVEFAAVAIAGQAKRGWYRKSAKALVDIFGIHDAPRFTALLAALSPQTSVENNAFNTLNVWIAWTKAGRPTDQRRITQLINLNVIGPNNKALPAWVPNSILALTHLDPASIDFDISGPKVTSFMRNLRNEANEVTNDAWMANFANIDQSVFKGVRKAVGGTQKGQPATKSAGYMGYSARVRQAANAAGALTSETWTAAEIQETVWSWARTLYNTVTENKKTGRGAQTAKQLIEVTGLSDEAIGSTPDFSSLFTSGIYGKILEAGGYGENLETARRGAETDGGDGGGGNGESGQTRAAALGLDQHLKRAAERLDQLRLDRLGQVDELLDEGEDADPIPSFTADQPAPTYELPDDAFDFSAMVAPDELDMARLPGLPPSSTGPIASVVEAARAYAEQNGIELRRQREYVHVDPARATRIASEYEAMKHDPQDPAVASAYKALINETLAQYQFVKASGLQVDFIEPGQADPYPEGPKQVLADLQRGHLWTFPTDQGFGTLNEVLDNPLLAPTEEFVGERQLVANDVFRIVHDFFGHGLEGSGFGARGEENAWQSHMRLFSPAAIPAMTSETRGQNSWVNFGPHGAANRANQRETVYADQKTGLMPEWTWTEGVEDDVDFVAAKALQTQAVSPTDFRTLSPEVLARPGWAIVTGTQEALGAADAPANVEANARLRAELKGTGAIEITGRYEGVDQGPSWIVFGSPDAALDIAKRYNQESVLTNEGLDYGDGTIVAAVPAETVVGPAARKLPFFSTLPNGESFAMGLDFGAGRVARPDMAASPMGTSSARGVSKAEPTRPAAGISEATAAKTDPIDASLAKISHNFIKLLNLAVRQGRFTMKGKATGQYSFKQSVVRLKTWNDLSVLVHEGGHHLHNVASGALTSFINRNGAELMTVADKLYGRGVLDTAALDRAAHVKEGFAEFFRVYVLNRAYAAREYPALTDQFSQLLATEMPEIDVGLDGVGTQFAAFLQAPSTKVLGDTVLTGTRETGINKAIEELRDAGFPTWFSEYARRTVAATVNRYASLNRTVADLLNLGQENAGKAIDLKRAEDPRVLARLAGNAGNRAMIQLRDGVMAFNSTKPYTASLQAALIKAHGQPTTSQLTKIDEALVHDFDTYLVALRAIDEYRRFTEGKIARPPIGFSLGDVNQAALDLEGKYPGFQDAARMVHEYGMALWQKGYDAGMVSQTTYESGLDRQFYVPLQRDMSDRKSPDLRPNVITGGRSIVKQFKGSDRNIVSPIAVLMEKTFALEQTISQNEIAKALAVLADRAGRAGALVERVPASQVMAQTWTVEEVAKQLTRDENISDVDAADLMTILSGAISDGNSIAMFRKEQVATKGENIIFFWENGQVQAIQLQDGDVGADIVNMFNAVGRENMSFGMDLIAGTSGVFRTAITMWPDFLIVNFIRDQMSTWILNEGFTPFVTGMRGVSEELRQRQWAQQANASMMTMGGMNVAALHDARVARDIKALRGKGYLVRTFSDRTPLGVLKGLTRFTELTETGTRIGLYRSHWMRAKADGLTDWEASIEAAYAATDTMDFGLNGSKMLVYRRTIPFLNAQLQGYYKMMRTLGADEVRQRKGLRFVLGAYLKSTKNMDLSRSEKAAIRTGRKAWIKMVGLGMISALLHFLFVDDPDYQEAGEYLRHTGWVIPLGDGRLFYIPKPFELAIIANATERALESASGDPMAGKRFLRGAALTMLPPIAPPVVQIAVELNVNKDFFSDREIVPSYMQALAPELQFNNYTSTLAKQLGQATGVSPMVLDHIMSGLGASAYRDIAAGTNALDATHPSMDATDAPILRRFIRDTKRGSASARDFWAQASTLNGRLRSAEVSYKSYLEAGNLPAANRFLQTLNDDEKAYALLAVNFKTDAKRLNPFYRGRQVSTIVSAMRREISSELSLENTDKYADKPTITLTKGMKRDLDELLGEYARREMRNTLIATNAPGWAGKKFMSVSTTADILEHVDPRVREELDRRLAKGKVYSAQAVFEAWPEARNRLLQDHEEAFLDDLVTIAQVPQ